MKFCGNCGAQMQDNERFCPQCGRDTAAAQQQPQQQAQQPYQQQAQQPYQQPYQQGYQQGYQQQPYANGVNGQPNAFQKFFNTPDSTAAFNPMDIQQNKFMAILSYFGLFALIPYFGAKQSPYAQYHAKQGMNLMLVDIGVGILAFLLGLIKVTKVYGWIPQQVTPGWVVAIQAILWLIVLAFAIIGIVNAAEGKAKELPIIGKYIKIFK
ncbi:MAG: zinc-ribbon domain-containing protein [Acutalibacteraceae bacterium]